MPRNANKIPLIRRPWFAFLSSMRFAVALLCVLAVASVIGTVLQQNQPPQNYVVKFGPFWAEMFRALGLFDVYASWWFVLIMLFLVLSTGLCLWRNIPPFVREMRSFRLNATAKSLAHMRHNTQIEGLRPALAARYLTVNGFRVKSQTRQDGSVLLAAKKGTANKWGYILAHSALIVICTGGLIDSNLLLKLGMLGGKIVPDQHAVFARDFQPESTLGTGNPSFRANAEIVEGQTADVAFVNADKGLLLQQLPFAIELKKFHIDFYDTGMPKDFASDLRITDKVTGEQHETTIRVNHPLTYKGLTVYQASYGDGGSDLQFRTWNLGGTGAAVPMKAVSQRQYPLDLGDTGRYRLEFGELRVYNVENVEATDDKDTRSVRQGKKFQNVGPTITFKLRDGAGQAREYVNYLLPLLREGNLFFATGERDHANAPYRWLMIPADAQGKPDGFMALRATLLNPEARAAVIDKTVAAVGEDKRPQFKLAVENLLAQFVRGGFREIDRHIQTTVPAAEQQKTGELMYQILVGTMHTLLDDALVRHKLPPMPAGEAKSTFVLNSLDAYTGLTGFSSPVLMQLTGYKQVNMSGLQISKSPGAGLVYLGSLLLVLGTVFMFYVREKRAWLLFDGGSARFAMSSSRSERDLRREFPEHVEKLGILARDMGEKT
ncbi:cytochrome c biogenesis protein ResB [Conchiformibius kuhniae]|uniref:Cytochrome c biogenesis protein ResB n=1 Tax=Conchiformibius kuhniae TaxID=211502 RepID=A0ABD8B762_9NEIS|nr:cytochrome c biogenesis protein ResB [Conchiformibius kuhniae]